MLKKLVLSLMLTFAYAEAWAVKADWACSSINIAVDVSLDTAGKLQMQPDVLSDIKKRNLPASELKSCLTKFESNINKSISQFKQTQCPASKSPFCLTADSYLNKKIKEKVEATLGITVVKSVIPKQTAESYLEEKIARKEIQMTSLNQTFNFGDKTYKVSEFDKVVGENIENVFMDLNRNEAKQYAQNYMLAKWDVLNTTQNSPKRTAVLNNLNQMMGYIYGESSAEELAKLLECKPEDELKPIEEIITRVEQIKRVSKCQPLEKGEHKIFKQDRTNYYGTGDYLLKRRNDGNYQAILNINFKSGKGSLSPQGMMARAKSCLAESAPYMKGPNGELMELVALTPDEINKIPRDERPNQKTITIEGPNHLNNSASYSENIPCRTIVHEMLHLLGLCDEYQENRSQYGNMWNCRVVTKAPSIMRELEVYDRAIPKTNRCECTTPPCSTVMKSGNENIKKIFTAKNAFQVVDFRFRAQYCSQRYLSLDNIQNEPSKALVINSKSERSFKLESRNIILKPSAPNYAVERVEISCNCPAGDSQCLVGKNKILQDVAKAMPLDKCPTNTKVLSVEPGKKVASPMAFSNGVLTIASEPEVKSLLAPSHFYKILEGTCPGKSQGYQECADFAYKSDKDKPCNVPDKCRSDSYFLGVPQ